MNEIIEFYDESTGKMITSLKSSIVPHVGGLINIEKKTWKVQRVTFAIDYAASNVFHQRQMRVNIDLGKYPLTACGIEFGRILTCSNGCQIYGESPCL